MKTRFLMPHKWRYVGITGLILDLVGIFVIYSYTPSPNISDLTNMAKLIKPYEGVFPLIFISLLFIGFSKEKIEDEHIAQIRLESLQWALIANYIVLFYCFLFMWLMGGTTILAVIFLNMLTPGVFFILRFRWKIWQLNHLFKKELAS